MNTNLKWLRERIKMLDMEGIIISNPINIRYLTGLKAEGILLITRKEDVFITDSRYMEEVNLTLTIDDEIVVYDVKDIALEEYENFFIFCENVGFEEEYVTYSKYKEILRKYKINNLQETDKIIEKQRMIKDGEEIEYLTRACEQTDRCFSHITKFIKIGMTEIEIAAEMERYFQDNGANGLAFNTIVASGENSSKPHAIPGNRKIELGDPITLDFGCKYNDYCSDMTRTVFAGYVPEEIKPIYELVLKNQKLTLKEYKAEADIRLLSRMVENDFRLHGFDLIHSLGHGIGLEVHEIPFINPRNDTVLKHNMIVSNEPGIYIPNKFGVRIEDTVLVGKQEGISLTKSPKDYVIVAI